MVQSIEKIDHAKVNCLVDVIDFKIMCLHPEVLRTAMVARTDIRRDDIN